MLHPTPQRKYVESFEIACRELRGQPIDKIAAGIVDEDAKITPT